MRTGHRDVALAALEVEQRTERGVISCSLVTTSREVDESRGSNGSPEFFPGPTFATGG